MPEYLSPGVYIEEVATGPVPIQGVGTSTAGFLGRTERGPENARQVNSFAEFKRLYGGFAHYKAGGRLESTYMAYGVEGFFRNGGSRCVVGRIVPKNTPTASISLANGAPPDPTPLPTLSTETVDFGTVATDETSEVTVTVSNPALGEAIPGDAIEVSVRDDAQGDFTAATTFSEPELGANKTMTVDVTFDPQTGPGPDPDRERSATLVVAYSDRDELTASLVGDAPDPATATHVLGTDALRETVPTPVIVGEEATITVSVQNLTGAEVPDADTDVTVSVVGDVHSDFSVTTGLSGAIPVGGADVTVTFEPQAAPETDRTATLTVDHDGTPQFEVALSGEATSPLSPETGARSFGTVPPGSSRTERIEFTNDGATELTVANVVPTVTGTGDTEFQTTVTSAAPTIGTGETLTVEVVFTPAVAETRTVTLALAAPSPATEPTATVTLTANTGPISVEAIGPGVWGRNVAVIVGDSELSTPANPLFNLTLRYWAADAAVESARLNDADPEHPEVPRPDHEEVYANLSPDESSSEYYLGAVNAASTLVQLEREGPGVPAAGGPVWLSATFTEEDANETRLTVTDFDGRDEPGDLTGFWALAAEDEVAIVCVPDEHSLDGLTGRIIDHCERLEDRFGVLQTTQRPGSVNTIRTPRPSEYAAIYYPWIEVIDPETNLRKTIPPAGHIAGVYARTDQERGVHKAPANTILRGAQALRPDVTRGDQDTLNPRNVNCIRSFPGRGIRVFGARTMASNAQWRYINVRRLFNFVEESIEESTQWAVFEPNDERLWARVRQSVSDFLTVVWRDGALAGTTPEEAFFVTVDRTTMTEAEINQGKLVVEVGIAPVKPAEFVIFRFSQKTREATS